MANESKLTNEVKYRLHQKPAYLGVCSMLSLFVAWILIYSALSHFMVYTRLSFSTADVQVNLAQLSHYFIKLMDLLIQVETKSIGKEWLHIYTSLLLFIFDTLAESKKDIQRWNIANKVPVRFEHRGKVKRGSNCSCLIGWEHRTMTWRFFGDRWHAGSCRQLLTEALWERWQTLHGHKRGRSVRRVADKLVIWQRQGWHMTPCDS